jgi:transcriptional regulator with XRE-family HTH domain
MSEPAATLGENVRRLRDACGMTQMALAVAAGVGVSQVSQIEQGIIKDPRLSTAIALARSLGVSLDVLAGVDAEAPGIPQDAASPQASQPSGQKPAKRRKGKGKS